MLERIKSACSSALSGLLAVILIVLSFTGTAYSGPPDPELVTAKIVVERCIRLYAGLAESYGERYNIDPYLILSVAANESACNRLAVSGDGIGSVGLMQIVPREWLPSRAALYNASTNMDIGAWFLRTIYDNPKSGGSWRRTLAAYNCGWVSLDAGKCIAGGGYDYADRVLEFWLPLMRANAVSARFRLWSMLDRGSYVSACYLPGATTLKLRGQVPC